MDNAAHTPGPWIIRAGHPCDVEAPETGHVASCETKEDARLIAAAPDMLALAQRAENVINELAKLGRCPIILRALAVDFRAAIAKAKGE